MFHLVEEYYREKGRSTTWLKKHLAKKLEERYVRYGMTARFCDLYRCAVQWLYVKDANG
ncbi:hypothetical protein D3C80_1807730 [compost metagenome]